MNIWTRLDERVLWSIRHFIFKAIAGRLEGIGYLGKPSFAKGFSRFYAGKGLGIFPGWRIEILRGSVNVGKNVRIGNNFFLNCGSSVTIGDGVTISGNVFIGTTDVKIDNDIKSTFKDWEEIERPIVVGNGSFIGYGAVLLPGTTLGQGCVVGANSVCRGSFPAGSVIAGSPAKVLRVRV